jgi:hypothetical protein
MDLDIQNNFEHKIIIIQNMVYSLNKIGINCGNSVVDLIRKADNSPEAKIKIDNLAILAKEFLQLKTNTYELALYWCSLVDKFLEIIEFKK